MKYWFNSHRIGLAAAVTLSCGILAGCPAKLEQAANKVELSALGQPPTVGAEPVSSGVYLPVPRGLDAAGLLKAKMDRAAILAVVRRDIPARTQPAARRAGGKGLGVEPPPLALKYYLHGRERFMEGMNTDAMEQLDKALQLDPEAFTVLRLMGRVCFAANQLARGNYYLQKAHALRPEDVEVNYLVGRYFLEVKDFPRSVHHLALAESSPDHDGKSAFAPLTRYYLGRALQSAGYHREAAKEFGGFVTLVNQPIASFRYDRELNYLMEERWAAHLSAAENFAAIQDYARALPHYAMAAEGRPQDVFVAGRHIAAQVFTKELARAQVGAMKLVVQSEGSADSVKLAQWVYRAAGNEAQLLADVRKQLEASADKASATRTLIWMLDQSGKRGEATAIIYAQLAQDPDDLEALGVLMTRLEKTGDYRAALRAAAGALARVPTRDEEIIKVLRPLMSKRSDKFALSASDSQSAQALYLDALAMAGESVEGRAAVPARQQLEKAVTLAPTFFPAREALIHNFLAAELFPQANDQLRDAIAITAADQARSKMAILQMESAVAQHHYPDAVKIGREAKAAFPRSTDIRMALASVYRIRRQHTEADAELIATIDEFPKFELAYQRLIDSYLERSRDEVANERMISESVAMLGRLVREVPGSRFGQLITAILQARTGRLEEGQRLLERMLKDAPADPDVLVPLAEIRFAQNEREAATALLREALERKPEVSIVQTLMMLYRRQSMTEEALDVLEKLSAKDPTNDSWILLKAQFYLSPLQRDEAFKVAEKAVADHPRSEALAGLYSRLLLNDSRGADAVKVYSQYMSHTGSSTSKLYSLAHLQSEANLPTDAEATMLRILDIIPDHSGANNDLGYFWADAGKNLDKAAVMIRKALTNQPNNEAFLDSLGWVYYKQGDFKQAITYLNQAVGMPGGREPELLSHLGDALYRAGKKDEAIDQWSRALDLVPVEVGRRSPIKVYLEKVLRQLRDGKNPEISPLGQGIKEEREL